MKYTGGTLEVEWVMPILQVDTLNVAGFSLVARIHRCMYVWSRNMDFVSGSGKLSNRI